MRRVCIIALAFFLLGAATARAELPADTLKAAVLPTPPGPHWVYLVDMGFAHMTEGRIILVNGDRKDVLGMVTTGFLAGVAHSPDHKELYVTETFYARGTRGERTDVMTIYRTDELKPIGEVIIPNKRFIAVTMPYGTVTTPDGRFLLQFNYTPATSVSVVDLKNRSFAGEIATPGCYLMYPAASSRAFSMICSDGKLLTVKLDESGRPVTQTMSGAPFFDPDKESLNVAPARVHHTLLFVSFHGVVHPLDLATDTPVVEKPWPLLAAKDKARSWRPGGWQYVAADDKLGRLYVAMHRGKDGSHKDPGTEIWVYNLKTHARIQRIRAKTPVVSLLTSRDDHPLLYALGAGGDLHVYDAATGRYRGSLDHAAETAMVMVNP